MTNQNVFHVESDASGERLDRFLSRSAGLSLRAARRSIESGLVTVDGRGAGPAGKLRPGQTVLLNDAGAPNGGARYDEPRLLAATAEFAAFFKPSGLHTVALAGSPGPSLEAMLPQIFPDGPVELVNRLDQGTSGIVLAARSKTAERKFRDMENRSEVDKRYLALAAGIIRKPMLLRKTLDTADRARVRVLPVDSADSTRWTWVFPVAELDGRTLVEARIVKGARHQIRAHLADAGHPLLGDVLHGGPPGERLMLHHWMLGLPGFVVRVRPDWSDPYELKVLLERFMEENPCES